jgi:hypothetical protein
MVFTITGIVNLWLCNGHDAKNDWVSAARNLWYVIALLLAVFIAGVLLGMQRVHGVRGIART